MTGHQKYGMVGFVAMALLSGSPVPAGTQYGSIVCIGDSITQADSGHQSYRYPLWKKLIDAGATFDLVGSMTGNYGGNPTWPSYAGKVFDQGHEGHWGWKADGIVNSLAGWLAGYNPDIALVHIGSNDAFNSQSASSTISEIGQIIDLLRADNPNVTVLLAQLIPASDSGRNARVSELNALIPGLASSKTTAQSPVIVVDQYNGFSASSDTYDGIHPDSSGEEKMAQQWMNALSTLGGVTAVSTPVISPAGGTHANSVEITLTCGTTGASMRYTTDGSTPGAATGAPYSDPFTLTNSATVKAIGCKSGMTNSAVASAVFTVVIPVTGQFVAYNDLSWGTSQLTNNITRYTTSEASSSPEGSSGLLRDYASGKPVSVSVSISGGSWDGTGHPTQGAEPASGTDAYNVFNGKVNCLGVISYGAPVVLDFTGMESGMEYEIVLYENRDSYDGTRWSTFTISDVDSFVNGSSSGAGAGAADASVTISAMNTTQGYVARYTGIDGGSDGDMRITMTGTSPYINAFMLKATASGGSSVDSDGDGMSDADETLAGTNPNDRNDVMAISESTQVSETQFTLKWRSVAGRTYRLMRGIDLTTGLNELVKGNIVASPPVNSETIALGQGCCYYRVSLQ